MRSHLLSFIAFEIVSSIFIFTYNTKKQNTISNKDILCFGMKSREYSNKNTIIRRYLEPKKFKYNGNVQALTLKKLF